MTILKKVPLTIYREGRKETIGVAELNEDGTITCRINDADLGAQILGMTGQINMSPQQPDRTDMCWNCAMGKCNAAEGDNTCFCCLNNHKVF